MTAMDSRFGDGQYIPRSIAVQEVERTCSYRPRLLHRKYKVRTWHCFAQSSILHRHKSITLKSHSDSTLQPPNSNMRFPILLAALSLLTPTLASTPTPCSSPPSNPTDAITNFFHNCSDQGCQWQTPDGGGSVIECVCPPLLTPLRINQTSLHYSNTY